MDSNALQGIDLDNFMKEDYDNTAFNVFDEGIAPTQCNTSENRRILLRNVPFKLKSEAIKRLLEQFGSVVDFSIPNNQDSFNNKKGFRCVFAEFELFSQAEKAVRELNFEKNEGLNIRACFAHAKKQSDEEVSIVYPVPQQSTVPVSSSVIIRTEAHRLPITIQYDDTDDDVFEKVSDFEHKKALMSYDELEQINFLKQLASHCKDGFNTDDLLFTNNPDLMEMPMKRCSNCNKEALLRCTTSSLLFCSIKCKLLKPKPSIAIKKDEIFYAEPIKLKDLVSLTSIVNEKCVYVRFADLDFNHHLNNVIKHSKGAQQLEELPEIGDVVLAKYLNEIYRAQVIDISDDDPCAITIKLIDYGNTACVSLDNLMAIGPECQRLECVVQKVILKDVKINAINWKIVHFLCDLLDNKSELVVAEDDSGIVLIDKSTETNINQRIVELSEVTKLEDDNGVLFCEHIEPTIPAGTNKKLFVVNSQPFAEDPDIICCVSKSKLKDLKELYKSINKYADSRKSETSGIPKSKGEICLVYANNQWHRAIVLKYYGDSNPLCFLIDLYNVQHVNVKQIRAMPNAFEHPSQITQLCLLGKQAAEVNDNDWINVDEILQEGNICKLITN